MKFKNYIANKIIPKIIKLLTFYFNYFNPAFVYNKLKKNPRIESVHFTVIRGIQKKEVLSPPRGGKHKGNRWTVLESSLETYGYDPEKFNYIELNQNYFIIEGKRRLCLLDSLYANPLKKIEVKIYDLDMAEINIRLVRRRMLFNFICISVITILILLLI